MSRTAIRLLCFFHAKRRATAMVGISGPMTKALPEPSSGSWYSSECRGA
nr:MAG TPA: hypothetical protein [Caudoviricetes sp.]